ncbi:hypothetical protein CCE02nite_28110 [Cellulosimicrobium cellulans]|uniref:Uncharacterized protein n=1 Tax=Cellulosimicrobium cellulans TaxID=1710 RepID=A0A4Y4DZL5_CELCE|nr:hypothetical protein CCE02nite_28110 [Cellulosimicrobium cellulans]
MAAEAARLDGLVDRARSGRCPTCDSTDRRDATDSEARAKGIDSDVVDTRTRADTAEQYAPPEPWRSNPPTIARTRETERAKLLRDRQDLMR